MIIAATTNRSDTIKACFFDIDLFLETNKNILFYLLIYSEQKFHFTSFNIGLTFFLEHLLFLQKL